MTDFASRHNNMRRFLSSSPWHFSIAQTTVEITIFILAQKLTTTDKYWWSLGPAKFDAAMAEFEAKTRRAEAPSILVCFLHIMHINVANSIYYHRVTSRHCYNNIISFNTANNTEMDCTTEQIMFVCVGVWWSKCGGVLSARFILSNFLRSQDENPAFARSFWRNQRTSWSDTKLAVEDFGNNRRKAEKAGRISCKSS